MQVTLPHARKLRLGLKGDVLAAQRRVDIGSDIRRCFRADHLGDRPIDDFIKQLADNLGVSRIGGNVTPFAATADQSNLGVVRNPAQALFALAQRILDPLALGDVDAFAEKKLDFSLLVAQRGHGVERIALLAVTRSIFGLGLRWTGPRQRLVELAPPARAHFRQLSPPGTIQKGLANDFLGFHAGAANDRIR